MIFRERPEYLEKEIANLGEVVDRLEKQISYYGQAKDLIYEERDNFKILMESEQGEPDDRLIYKGWYEALNFVIDKLKSEEDKLI
tara:strand:- start:756 stop:1010 length:255 start_codon:yes stop_codon:yes gene_type:complete